jgi:hypothetical protein
MYPPSPVCSDGRELLPEIEQRDLSELAKAEDIHFLDSAQWRRRGDAEVPDQFAVG